MDLSRFRGWLADSFYGLARKYVLDDLPAGDHHPLSIKDQAQFSDLLPYRSFDPHTQLYQLENTVGMILEIDPIQGLDEGRTQILAQIFGQSLPDGVHVQVLNWASPKVGDRLEYWARARSEKGGIFAKLGKARFNHLKRGAWSSLSKGSPVYLREFRVVLAFEMKGFFDGEAGERLCDLRETVRGTLSSLGSTARTMEPDDFLSFLKGILNPTSSLFLDSEAYQPDIELKHQIVRKDTMFGVYKDHVTARTWAQGDILADQNDPRAIGARSEKYDMRTFSVSRFPNECSQGRMNALLGDLFQAQIQPRGSNLMCLYFHNRTYVESKTTAEMKAMRANQQAASPMAKLNPGVTKEAADWNYVNEQVILGSKLVDMMMFVTQTSPDGEGEEDERYLRTVFLNAGFQIERNDLLHLAFLLGSLPCTMGDGLLDDFKKLNRSRTQLTDVMALIAPVQGEPKGFATPTMMLAGRRGQLFYWSPFANAEEGGEGGNHNTSVIGGSGSGKSVLMAEMASSLFSTGAHVMVFDDGESFKNTCRLLNGEHIDFSMDKGLCINPFSMCDHEIAARDEEYLSDCKSGIVSIILQMAKGKEVPTQYEAGCVSDAVNFVWDAHGPEGNIDHVAKRLLDNDGEVGNLLFKSLTDYQANGNYGKLFNGPCNVRPTSEFIVFELSPLESKPDLRAVVVLSLLMVVAQRMKFVDRRIKKGLFIDEAWKMLADGAAGSFIEGFARRCRKMGGALITGTQSLDDYERTTGSQACIQNSDWQIILKVKQESLSKFEKSSVLTVSESEMRILRSLKTVQDEYSEVYIRGPGCQTVGRFLCDPFSLTLYSTKPSVFGAVQELQHRGMSIEDAIEYVAFKKGVVTPEGTAEQVETRAELYSKMAPLARLGDEYIKGDDRKRRRMISSIYKWAGLNDEAA